MVKVCPKCGGVMIPRKENGRIVLVCNKCGYRREPSGDALKESYKISKKIERTPKESTIVISEEDTANLPISKDVTCPKCGHHEAYYWMIQTRAADEPATRFYKCTKCGHVWREYE